MFDISSGELLIVAVLALLVIGPKELPKVMATIGRWSRKIRYLASDFQRHLDDMARETELDEVRQDVNRLRSQAKSQLDEVTAPLRSWVEDEDEDWSEKAKSGGEAMQRAAVEAKPTPPPMPQQAADDPEQPPAFIPPESAATTPR